MARLCFAVIAALAVLAVSRPAVAASSRALMQNAGPWNENSLVGVPSEVKTGEQYGAGQKVNVCKFQLGTVNNWEGLHPMIQYLPLTAEVILETSGRGSFIAPAQGFLHYGPSCYLYDHVCNFNYQEPCNLHGTCQTNNTCFCTNGYKTCRPNDGTLTSATAGCETNIYTDVNNCGACGNVCPTGTTCDLGTCASATAIPPPPPPTAAAPPPPPPPRAAVTNGAATNTGNSGTGTAAAPGASLGSTQDGEGVLGGTVTQGATPAQSKAANAARKAAAKQAALAAQVDGTATAGRRLLDAFFP